MNTHQQTASVFDGLALHDQLPLAWEPSSLEDAAVVEHCNQETARALQAIALFEEAPKEVTTEAAHAGQDLQHLEAKVDVLLSLVTRLIGDRHGTPARHATILRADSLEWAGPLSSQVRAGDTGIMAIYANPLLPLPFRIGCRIIGTVERGGMTWRLSRFEQVNGAVASGLEKLIFRRHRRQVALSRGTDVLSKTGILRAPKL